MRVIKRDGSIQEFDEAKVKRSLLMAFSACNGPIPNVMPIVQDVCRRLNVEHDISVTTIQDVIELVLVNSGFDEVSRCFHRYRIYRNDLRQQRYTPDSEALRKFIFYSKYSREGEDWHQCIQRTIDMHVRKFPKLEKEIKEVFKSVHWQAVLPSMRCLQFGGKAIEAHNARMYNCSFTNVERWQAFGEILYLLLCGCGVGFSVQLHHVSQLEKIPYLNKRIVRHHIIEDSIEGWKAAIDFLILCSLQGYWAEFGYHEIRAEGSLLVTSGGIAPGHLALKESIEAVRGVLLKVQGRKLRPIEVYDIICHLATCVMAGGIRRSSLIALFSLEDVEMLYAKTPGVFDPKVGINLQRCQANNSVVIREKRKEDFSYIMELSQYFGEPGFVFLDKLNWGVNPCGEILLQPFDGTFDFCNLTEVDYRHIDNLEENIRVAAIIGTLQSAYNDFSIGGKTILSNETIVKRPLLGVSLTGLMDVGEFDQLRLNSLKEIVINTNKEWARKLGINEAVRHTCIKPSGTASLLLGCSNGIHPRYSRRYFRRVIFKNEPAALHFAAENPHMVEVSDSGSKWLVFPIEAPANSVTLRDITAIEQLDNVLYLTRSYVNHSVSCTITVAKGELEEAIQVVKDNYGDFRALSFVPKDIEHIYPHAPFEAVQTLKQEKYWNMLIGSYRPVKWNNFKGIPNIGSACDGAKCDYMVPLSD